jgi:hypothetical protein
MKVIAQTVAENDLPYSFMSFTLGGIIDAVQFLFISIIQSKVLAENIQFTFPILYILLL